IRVARVGPDLCGRGLRGGGRRAGGASSALALRQPVRALRDRHRPRLSSLRAMRLRDLPSVDELARQSDDPLAVEVARKVVTRAREQIQQGDDPGDLGAQLQAELTSARAPHLRRAINPTRALLPPHPPPAPPPPPAPAPWRGGPQGRPHPPERPRAR